ncbi:transcription repressor OFP8-like [Rutidosis leptorrhynchoides]|uniref:transcription repressor OFP8-like n=1 Tax=Rutidosis leptorrhynchoides TaxID=125765 RepID=UPI003A991412
MDNNFKLRISKLFQSSFNSCRTEKHFSDVAEKPFFFPENRHHRQLIDLFSPKPQPLSYSSCKPKPHYPKPKTSDQKTHFPAAKPDGKPHSIFPVAPPLFYDKKPKTTKTKKPHYRKPIKFQDFTSTADNYYYDCCSSDEDYEIDDETTLFSSRSFSSESSVSFYKNRVPRRKKSKRGGCRDRKATDVIPIKGKGKIVKDSVAIVKKSSNPHEDFRVSMLEMIVERQIFGTQDLENLLQCFLSLNSEEHHRVICDVFTEIWETLFSNYV